MVGTMKRYDPAYERLAELLPVVSDLRLIRVTTLESPFAPYVAHYPLIGMDFAGPAPPLVIGDEERAALDAALGDVDEQTRWCYRWIMLDNLVHELNMLGGLLGEPDEIRFAHLSPQLRQHRHAVRRDRLPPVVGRPAGDRALPPGAVLLRAGAAADARAPVAVPAQHAEPPDHRGRRGRQRAQLGARGDRLLRGGVQARARRVLGLHPHRARAADLRRGRRCATCGSPRRWRARTPPARRDRPRRDGASRIEAGVS